MPFLHMRACQAEIDAWYNAAAAAGLSLSDWVRSRLNPGLDITFTVRSIKGRERSKRKPKTPVITPAAPIPSPQPKKNVNTQNPLCARCLRLGPPSRPCPSCGASSAPPLPIVTTTFQPGV